jgi:hypothetical protein
MEPCCTEPSNLRAEPSGADDLVLRRCQICQRRHFELTLNPGVIGLTGAALSRLSA